MISASVWTPDLPDFRDKSVIHSDCDLLQPDDLPSQKDLSEYFLPVENLDEEVSSVSLSVGGLVEFFNRRFCGDTGYVSKIFIHENANRIQNGTHSDRASIRSALKAVSKLGVPPARFSNRIPTGQDAFLFSFKDQYKGTEYFRVDSGGSDDERLLPTIKGLLCRDRPCVFGFSVMSSMNDDGVVDMREHYDEVLGSSTGVIVGYDDNYRIAVHKGAFLFRSTFGSQWGDSGYGWINYRYVERQMMRDIWTLTKPGWRD